MRRWTMMAAVLASTVAGAQPRLTPENIDTVVARMTLEEKARLLCGAPAAMRHGMTQVADADGDIPGAAGPTASFDAYGIPPTIFADGPAGLRIAPRRPGDARTYHCTAFPVGTLLAATWSTDTAAEVGRAMGDEALAYGVDALLTPSLNIHRNPLCGRNFEYFSEDPLLSGELAAAVVRGVQGAGVGACLKHFAANNQETGRDGNDVRIGVRALREIYLRGFRFALRRSDPWLVMTSYNRINGTFCCEDGWLLEEVLRGEWGFGGMVVTDWTGPRTTAAQVAAGNDLLMPGSERQVDEIVEAVRAGRLNMDDVDRNARRVLRYVVRTPRFRRLARPDSASLTAHAALARRAAAEGMVLLKNDGVLPLRDRGARIALYGVGAYALTAGGMGSGHVNRARTTELRDALAACGFAVDAPLAALYDSYIGYERSRLSCAAAWVVPDFGLPPLREMPLDTEAAARRERESDVAVVWISRASGEARDRSLMDEYHLTAAEQALLRDVAAAYHRAGKKVVAVLNIDAPVEVASWRDAVDAILCAWLPGQEGGGAVADVLTGAVNPSGRLPMTFPLRWEDHASSRNFPVEELAVPQPLMGFPEPIGPRKRGKDIDSTAYAEGIWVGYRHFDRAGVGTAYPFGFGLSYTTFRYGTPRATLADGVCRVTVEVTNTGTAAGREVVQLYAAAPPSHMEKPRKELRAFARTGLLSPGRSERVSLSFPIADLASYDETARSWVLDGGRYRLLVAASAEDIRAETTLRIPPGAE